MKQIYDQLAILKHYLINEAQDNLKKESIKKYLNLDLANHHFPHQNTAVESLKVHASQHDYLPVSGLKNAEKLLQKLIRYT